MVFSEIYGSYFNVVAAVLREAAEGGLTPARLTAIVQERAFAESTLSIPAALRSGAWPLLDGGGKPVLDHPPTMPLTTLQRRWLKALLLDPRIQLFDPDPSGLEDVEPLFRPEDLVFFDRCTDGDSYGDPAYVQCFRTVLRALREQRRLYIRFRGQTGTRHAFPCTPHRLEYSSKDDKFRLLASGKLWLNTINLARVSSCKLLGPFDPQAAPPPARQMRELTLLLRDERNALERVLLHFSHFEKETLKLEEGRYQIKLRYDREDEAELLIRVLSFGPVLEVQAPEEFAARIRSRVQKQLDQICQKGAETHGETC